MNEENIIKLVRWGMGVGLLAVYAITKTDGMVLATGMALLGIPIEVVASGTRQTSED